jgi:parallel beta-helix repeat protein
MYDRSLTVDEIDNSNKTSVFYILNACSACRWDNYVSSPTNPNYLGGIYVFDKSEMDYGLGVIGFTGVGGFNVLNFFSDYLNMNPNGSYGEAYKYWFNENLMHTTSAWNYVYLGDPTIGPKIPSLVQNVQTGLRYEDIQDAINAPETLNGHTIIVGAGIYRENVVLNKTLSLVGEDRVRTILDGNGTGNVIYVTRDSVVISNFTVTNSGSAYPNSGIFLGSVGNSTISNNVVSHNQGYGIFLMWGSNNSVLDNIVEYNLQPGVRIDGATSGARVANNVIRFNQPDGIFLYYAFDIVIQDNLVVQNKQCGITPQGGSHNVTIRRNKIVNNGWHGILMVVSDSSTVEENEIVSNGFSGVDSVGASIGNVIQNNTVRENGCGISFSDSSSNFIYRNYFIDNFDQVRVQNSTNVWDNGYPIGGNYWGDYKGTDFFSGPYQNITGSDGIGDTPYVIDENNLDHYPLDVHNVAVMDVTVSKTIVCKGYLANFKIMVENQGNHPETFNVTIYAISLTDTSVIGRWEVTLSPGEKNTSSFVWNTTSFAKGNYTISSNASQVMDEIDIYDNAFADNWISVSTLGDINADGKVDVKDVYAVGRAYGTSLEGPNPSGRTYNPNCDINGDDKVDVKDYYIVCKHYGEVDP